MSILALTSDTLIGTAAAGNIEYNGQFFGTDSNASRAQMQRITSGTAVASTSGAAIDFTGLPAWVKKITVMFSGISTSSTSNLLVQLGTSSGVTTSGYLGRVFDDSTTHLPYSAGFILTTSNANGNINHGLLQIATLGSNLFAMNGILSRSDAGAQYRFAGSVPLAATLDRVRITTVNGTDTFDAGSVNIMYEG